MLEAVAAGGPALMDGVYTPVTSISSSVEFIWPGTHTTKRTWTPSTSATTSPLHSSTSMSYPTRSQDRQPRLAVGSKRPRTNLNRIEDHASNHDTPLLNRKRAAKSLTDADPSQRSLTDLWTDTRPPKKKKKKEEEEV
ncbi:hypothetical protein THAOC_18217 [Thalassiosira oceanica]|uniref:Uncharacterized protein n=1 Tax=Thalassiosira oceanica TaxID=159749 RepID=K0S5G1_THAOC|nr:hypothetical protein THAOC_18217 [Thalassiosira oceanica]|eukprot:EJK61323.1 hypothetical protein THAOC_18217 [Thalassiosira oceanica]